MAGERNGCTQRAEQALSVEELIGHKIQLRRVALRMSIDELARAIGVSPAQLEAFESGRTRVEAQRLAAIAEELGVSAAWFFIRMDERD